MHGRFAIPAALALALSLGGCATPDNLPINKLLMGPTPTAPKNLAPARQPVAIGLAFSGGGTRAAAFAFGVLKELAKTDAPEGGGYLLADVDFVTSVSGGSITAAYFGYRGAAALDDFRERFLLQDMESHLHTSVFDPENWIRLFSEGGVNDRREAQHWLDANLFDGSTFAAMEQPDRPIVWINASDIYDSTPFTFDHETFDALCSDLTQLPISEAVAASAAVPVAFAPVAIESYAGRCQYRQPEWIRKVLANSTDTSGLQDYARALANYQNPDRLRYVKLLDGGLTDNYGLSAITLRREEDRTSPYAPLTPEQAVSLDRLLFVVVDAGQSTTNSWVMTTAGPAGVDLAMAAINTPLVASKRASYDNFRTQLMLWRDRLTQYRCKQVSEADVLRIRGTLSGWRCDDVRFFVADVNFGLLDPADRDRLSRLPTTLVLPQDDVDALIAGGREALRRSKAYRDFLAAPGAETAPGN